MFNICDQLIENNNAKMKCSLILNVLIRFILFLAWEEYIVVNNYLLIFK